MKLKMAPWVPMHARDIRLSSKHWSAKPHLFRAQGMWVCTGQYRDMQGFSAAQAYEYWRSGLCSAS